MNIQEEKSYFESIDSQEVLGMIGGAIPSSSTTGTNVCEGDWCDDDKDPESGTMTTTSVGHR